MTDIDRRLRHVDRVQVPDLWDRIETTQPRQAPPPSTAGRVLTVALALALAATGMFFALRAFVFSSDQVTTPATLPGSDVLTVPSRGEASPDFLADGRPVFVMHHENGVVSVFDAFSTHRPWGVEELVGWCASGRYFQEFWHGASFNEFGRWLDGPASADLAYFETERMPDGIQVGSRVVPQTRSERTEPGYQGPPCYSDGMVPGQHPPLLLHRFPESATFASPAEAIEAQPEEWIKLHGVLLVRRNEPTYLCASVEGDACSSSAVVEGIEAQAWLRGGPIGITENGELIERAKEDGRRRIVEEGQWIARVEGDRLSELTRIDTRVDVTER